jgi:GMP reductase
MLSLQVDLYREITFRNSKQTYKGIPVIASNMDTVGTFEMAKALAKVSMLHLLSKRMEGKLLCD